MSLVLEPIAREQAATLRNLFELYVYDFSETMPLELQESGRFDLPLDERWWSDADHFPFFLRSNDKLVGFALVRKGSRIGGGSDVMDVAEFFVARGARRRGLGVKAAQRLFENFNASWEIRVRETNVSAASFWAKVVELRTGRAASSEAYSLDGVAWRVFRLGASA